MFYKAQLLSYNLTQINVYKCLFFLISLFDFFYIKDTILCIRDYSTLWFSRNFARKSPPLICSTLLFISKFIGLSLREESRRAEICGPPPV